MEETGTGRPKWGQWFILTIETQRNIKDLCSCQLPVV